MKANNRNSAIELLRILAMCGVVILHYNNASAGGGLAYASGANHAVLMWLESVCIDAVNLYVLISGYFLCVSRRRRAIKPLELLAQVSLFGFGLHLLSALLSGQWSVSGILMSLIPSNYFVTLYVTLYLLSPYVNLVLEKLSDRRLKVLVSLMLALFSIWLTVVDFAQEILHADWSGLSTVSAYGSQWGYTLVNFLLMYVLGAYIRRNQEQIMQIAGWKYLLMFFAGCAVVTVWAYGYEESAWAYCNPIVVLAPCSLLVVFLKWNFSSKLVNTMAKSAFTCFLAHGVFITRIGIPQAVQASLPVMLGHIVISTVVIYAACHVIYLVWDFVTKPVFRTMGKRLESLDSVLSLEDGTAEA